MRSIQDYLVYIVTIFVLAACSSDLNSTDENPLKTGSLKYGVVYNSCGPADAPVVRLILTDEEFSCKDNPGDIKHISSYLEIRFVEDIKTGMVISGHSPGISGGPDEAYECKAGFTECKDIGIITINILSDEGGILHGTWHLQGSDRGGYFNIKKCSQERDLCG